MMEENDEKESDTDEEDESYEELGTTIVALE